MDRQKFQFLFFVFVAFIFENYAVIFKMTNAHCESLNPSRAIATTCILKAKSRNMTVFNFNVTFPYPEDNIHMKLEVKKKANGYKPFLINLTVDACAYMRKPNNPMAKIIFSLIREFSTVNHTCPYVGKQIVKDFYLKPEKLFGLPLPTGDYLLLITWMFDMKPAFVTNVYFTFVENLI